MSQIKEQKGTNDGRQLGLDMANDECAQLGKRTYGRIGGGLEGLIPDKMPKVQMEILEEKNEAMDLSDDLMLG